MSTEKVTVPEAAKRLGLTEGAVRQRVARGTLGFEKDDDGRVYVYVNRLNTEYDGEETSSQESGYSDVVEILKEQNEYLRSQLDKEREANRENRRLLAAALERIPAIEAPGSLDTPPESPRDEREAPVTASEEQGGGEEAEHRQPWWVRWFGSVLRGMA